MRNFMHYLYHDIVQLTAAVEWPVPVSNFITLEAY
jgi:hypothetical protein